MKKILSLSLILSLFLLAVSGCGPADEDPSTNPNTGREVKVFNWGDYIDPTVTAQFEQETGIKVIYSMFDTNEDMYALIRASGATSYDVIIPSDYMIQKMIKEDMLLPLNVDNIPNLSLIDERFLDREYDPGNVYSVPYMWGTLGIVYNATMVDQPITSWADLWNTKYEKNLFMMDSVRDSLGLTLKMMGHSMNTRDEAIVDQAYEKLKEQKPLVLAYTGDEVKDKMVAGEAAMAVVYSGDAITIREQNADIRYVIPSEGSNLWFDAMCILASSKNVTEAEEFINFMCRADIALLNYQEINFASPHKDVIATYTPEQLEDPAVNPSDEDISRCDVFADLGEYTAVYDEMWTRLLGS